ncbi:MAG TPA: ABC transporter ATP-binding protein [Halococcus sp.]|nr:ABC transporter ATP-binding protein [Halococcus sp.]
MDDSDDNPVPDGGTLVRTNDSPTLIGENERDGTMFGDHDVVGEELVLGYSDGEQPVIDGESLAIPSGCVTALVGPNGSGKSTLLRGLAHQHEPEAGVIRLDGRDIQSLGSKELARKLGLLSQENVSPSSLTVSDLAMHGRYPYRGVFDTHTDEDEAAVERALSLAGVSHLRDREIGSLSGGQKQLAWIGMVLAQDTDVLLLDEPTTFLDLHHQLEVMDIVAALKADSEVTVVLVLHDINQAARYADYMLALDDGEIYARGPPDEIVSEELLREVFGVSATVEWTEHGPQITPHRAVHD